MIRRRLLAVTVALIVAASVPAAGAASGVTVSVDRTAVATKLGRTFVLRSTVANHGPRAAAGLIAHLNVLSLRGEVYVDPEDWSSHRTRYLQPIPAGATSTLTWTLDAVNAGEIGVYVAVLPGDGAAARPVTAPVVRVTIGDRRTLDAGGILPLSLGLPGALGLVTVGLRLARRRATRATGSPHEA